MENRTKLVSGTKAVNGAVVGAAEGREYVVVSALHGADWHGRYGRRPQRRLKSETRRTGAGSRAGLRRAVASATRRLWAPLRGRWN